MIKIILDPKLQDQQTSLQREIISNQLTLSYLSNEFSFSFQLLNTDTFIHNTK